LDHVVEWQHDGATCEANLCALCTRHHDLKEHHGWQVVLHDDRTVEWTTPTGHTYTSAPADLRITIPTGAGTSGATRTGPGTTDLCGAAAVGDGSAPF
jgi:hypothetical protein